MEWIRRAKQDDLRRLGSSGQMHRRGIDRDQQSRLRDECSEREQVRPAAQIDNPEMIGARESFRSHLA